MNFQINTDDLHTIHSAFCFMSNISQLSADELATAAMFDPNQPPAAPLPMTFDRIRTVVDMLGYYHGFISAPGNNVYDQNGEDMTALACTSTRGLLVRILEDQMPSALTSVDAVLAHTRKLAEDYVASVLAAEAQGFATGVRA